MSDTGSGYDFQYAGALVKFFKKRKALTIHAPGYSSELLNTVNVKLQSTIKTLLLTNCIKVNKLALLPFLSSGSTPASAISLASSPVAENSNNEITKKAIKSLVIITSARYVLS